MRNFKLTIEYRGTNYHGWQNQKAELRTKNSELRTKNPGLRTIQGEIERALKEIFAKNIRLIGSGRTDSGVHALGQIANFKCLSRLSAKTIRNALNNHLPADIRILKTEETVLDFHARFSAQAKHYRYLILNKPVASAFYREFCWWIPGKLNFAAMRREGRVLLGRHDFRAFTAADAGGKPHSFVRSIRRLSLKKHKDFIILDIEANGFLYKMVRNIVGTLVDMGRGRFPAGGMERILVSRKRKIAGRTAPACGLFLVSVKY